MIGLSRLTANKFVLFGLVVVCLCFLLVSVDASFKAHKRFAKHLYKFMKKEKYFFKKKGLEAAALIALSSMGKKKIFPVPLPLPIPIVHQPIIHEPMFIPPPIMGKGTQKGMAFDMLTASKHGGGLGVGGLGMGGLGMGGLGMGGLGMGGLGLGGLGGLGLGGLGGMI